MQALITGINGFVGGWLARRILETGGQVLGLARGDDRSAWDEELSAVRRATWDVTQPVTEELIAVARDFRPDVVFHLAGISNPGSCGREEPTPLAWAANVTGVERVLGLVRALDPLPRVVFASSSYVYAPVETDAAAVDEESPPGPVSAYGKTKLAAEEVLRASGCEFVIARIFNHTGPGQLPPFLFPELIQQAADPAIDSLRLRSLDFTLQTGDVRDLARALIALAERGRRNEAYNIAGATPRTGREWIELLRLGTGTKKPLVVEGGASRANPTATCAKLARDTEFQPEFPPERTFRDMLSFALKRL